MYKYLHITIYYRVIPKLPISSKRYQICTHGIFCIDQRTKWLIMWFTTFVSIWLSKTKSKHIYSKFNSFIIIGVSEESVRIENKTRILSCPSIFAYHLVIGIHTQYEKNFQTNSCLIVYKKLKCHILIWPISVGFYKFSTLTES